MKIIFFGTPTFAASQLQYLVNHNIQVIAVVTQPDRKKGRSLKLLPSPVKEMAKKCIPGIPIFQPTSASDPNFIQLLKNCDADLFIVVAYGQILKQELIDLPKLDIINVHTSLLPKYRGAAPIQRALMDGQDRTGITIMKIVPKLDAGDIIYASPIDISENMTFLELEELLSERSGPALVHVIKLFENNQVSYTPQDDSLATYAEKIDAKQLYIDFSKTATELHNRIRALSPKPGAYFLIEAKGEQKRIKIIHSKVIKMVANPFEIVSFSSDNFTVACGTDALQILTVQPEGKKIMPAGNWIRGCKDKVYIKNN